MDYEISNISNYYENNTNHDRLSGSTRRAARKEVTSNRNRSRVRIRKGETSHKGSTKKVSPASEVCDEDRACWNHFTEPDKHLFRQRVVNFVAVLTDIKAKYERKRD